MLRSVLLTGIALALVGLARLGFNAVALNGFGEELAGRLNVALSLGMLVSLPVSTAFGPTALRFMGQALGQGRLARAAWTFRLLLVLTLVGAAVSTGLVWLGRDEIAASRGIDARLVVLGGAVALAYTLYLYTRNVLYAVGRVGLYTAIELISGVVFFAVLLGLFASGRGDLLLVSFVAGYLVFTVFALLAERQRLRRVPEPVETVPWRELGGYATLMLVGAVSSLSVREIVVLLAPSADDMGGAAHLALSLSLLTPLQMLPRMLRTVLFAKAAELDGRGDHEALGRTLTESNHWLFLANVPVCGVALVLAEPIIVSLGGDPTPERLLVFRLLLAGAVFEVLATPVTNALPGIGEVRVPAFSAVAGLLAAALVWLASPRLGIVGLSLGLVVSSVVKSAVPMWVARQRLGVRATRSPRLMVSLTALSAAAWIAVELRAPAWPLAAGYALLVTVLAWASLAELWRLARRFMPPASAQSRRAAS